jgi:hypothetical protein
MFDKADWKNIVVGGVAAAGGIVTVIWSLSYLLPANTPIGASDKWQAVAMLAIAVGIAFGVAAMLKFALSPLVQGSVPTSAPSTDADASLRGRLAPYVLTIGSIAVVLLALVLIIGFIVVAQLDTNTGGQAGPVKNKLDTLVMGVFATVLPVLATWVGTILAFYFGSENFRQAAQNTRDALSATAGRTITDVMKPYDRISRVELAPNGDPATVTAKEVVGKMSQATPRVIIFNSNRNPIYVIRASKMPANWITADYNEGSAITPDLTIQSYLSPENKADAEKRTFIADSETPEATLAAMVKKGVDDVFVTKDGQDTSPTLGWAASNDLLSK